MARRSPQSLALTQRDLEMLWSLSQARYLPVEALEWLHVGSWQQRWQRWRDNGSSTHRYRPSTRLYERLHRMEQAELLLRIHRPVSLAVTTFGREPDLYMLSQRGADLLAEYGGVDRDAIHYETVRQRSFLMLSHSAEIGRAYAALRAIVEQTQGLAFHDWQGDHLTAQAYDRIAVPVGTTGGRRDTPRLPVQPDGTFCLGYRGGTIRCFLEVDRGRSIRTWIDKIRAYHAYTGSHELAARYNTQSFVLLTLTTTTSQRQRLMEATAQVLGQPDERYLFGLLADVHPSTIGTHWLKVTEVQMLQQQHGIQGPVQRAVIATAPHVFIRS